jgi:two-component system, sensor histidine kinase and response regulator
MHYIGMESMRLPGMCSYSWPIVALSIVLAIVISFLAMSLTFCLRDLTAIWSWRKSGCALLMGLAIPVTHYVGMAAVSFMPAPLPASSLTHAVNISQLTLAGIAVVTLILLGIVFLASMLDCRFSLDALQLKLSEERYRHLAQINDKRERSTAAEAASHAKSEFLAT